MEGAQIKESKKRSIGFMQAQDLESKLKSKIDIVYYLEKHRKYCRVLSLTPI